MSELDAEALRLLLESVEARVKPDAGRTRAVRDHGKGFDAVGWNAIVEAGWLGVLLPEVAGGTDLGLRAASVIARRLGYAGWLTPYVGAGIAATACVAACPRATATLQRAAAIAAGDELVALAWQPTGSSLDVGTSTLTARALDRGVAIDGQCRFVVGAQATTFILAAVGATGMGLYWLPRDSSGLEGREERAADGTTLLRLECDGVRVGDRDGLAIGAQAERALAQALAFRLTATSAELLGHTERVLELTLDHLRQRRQFDQPIGAFQVLQHRAVDMWIQQELAAAALETALRACDDDTDARLRRAASSSAKARAAHAAQFVCSQAIQLHGAIGFTDEYELGLHVNRALVLAADFGNASVHRRIHADTQACAAI